MQKLKAQFVRFINRSLYIAFSVGLLVLFWQSGAYSHKTNLSRSQILLTDDGIDIRLAVSAHDLAVAVGIKTDLIAPIPRHVFDAKREELATYFIKRLHISSGDQACRGGEPNFIYSDLPSDLIVRLSFTCPGDVKRFRVTYQLFFDIDPSHRGIGRLDTIGQSQEFLFDIEVTELEFSARPVQERLSPSFSFRIFSYGVEHIMKGFDHLLFLIILLLVARRLLELISIVTAFTIAHSITLALAWFDLVVVADHFVESLIALSIAYVAAENIWGGHYKYRWMLVFFFGTIHGLGFSTVLREVDTSGVGILTTLLAFNLGVEAGQLLVVAVTYPLITLFQRQDWYTAVMRAGSALVMIIASILAIQRLVSG